MNVNYIGSASAADGRPSPHVMIVHRFYRVRGGEDYFLTDVLIPALMALNVSFEVVGFPALFAKPQYKLIDLIEIAFMALGLEKWRPSYLETLRRLSKSKPTHVLFNNFVPTVSLEAPALAKSLGAETIAWVHNSRLSCANGLSFNGKSACKKCLERGSHWALIQNCFESRKQGLIYSLIYRKKRVARKVAPAVQRFVAVSDYSAGHVKEALASIGGSPAAVGDVAVLRSPAAEIPAGHVKPSAELQEIMQAVKKLPQPFFAFVGRVSREKGADVFFELARAMPEKGFLLCGEGPMLAKLKESCPKNLHVAGFIGPAEKSWVYQNAAALVISSRVPENAPMVIGESQKFGTPIVYPKGGGAEELVIAQKRTGCEISELKGQTFKRTTPDEHPVNEFTPALARIFNVPYLEP